MAMLGSWTFSTTSSCSPAGGRLDGTISSATASWLWDAFFFSTVQLLTVSSHMPNPVTTGGRIVDILLQLTAICLVTGVAGAFASFFLSEETDKAES